MKRRIVQFLVSLIDWLDPQRIEIGAMTFNQELSVSFKKLVPKDGKWHQCTVTFSAWLFTGATDVKMRVDDEATYIDGACVSTKKDTDNGMEPWTSTDSEVPDAWRPEHRPNAYWDKIKNEWVDYDKTKQ